MKSIHIWTSRGLSVFLVLASCSEFVRDPNSPDEQAPQSDNDPQGAGEEALEKDFWKSGGKEVTFDLDLKHPTENIGTSAQLFKNVRFCEMGGVTLSLDLARPLGVQNAPVQVLIHGGGFVGGNRSVFLESVKQAALGGWVAATVDYRLSSSSGSTLNVGAHFPAAILDVACAIRWLKKNALTLGLDPLRIGVHGVSAGGYLSLMVGQLATKIDDDGNRPYPQNSSSISAMSSWCGPANLLKLVKMAVNPLANVATYLGVSESDLLAPQTQSLLEKASPSSYLKKEGPPILIQHGMADTTVNYNVSVDFQKRASDLGADVELRLYENEVHDWSNGSQPKAQEATVNFLKENI